MRGLYKSIAILITNSLHDLGGGQGDNGTDVARGCSPLYQGIIYPLADLCCVGIAHDEAA